MSPQSAEINLPGRAGGAAPRKREIKSYVLRAGRQTAAQKRSYKSLSGKFIIPYGPEKLDFAGIFGNDNPVIVEIGFGMGRATAIIANENPDKNYIGLEIHKPGIGRLLWEIEHRLLSNVRIIEHDAAEVFQNMIPEIRLAACISFFPIPGLKSATTSGGLYSGLLPIVSPQNWDRRAIFTWSATGWTTPTGHYIR